MGERARDAKRRVDGQLAEADRELVEVVVVAGVRALRQGADLFDAREQLRSFMMSQHLPEQLAQQPDIVAQRLMRVGHRWVRLKPDATGPRAA